MTVVLVHEIYEMHPPRDYPVVTHEFRGETEEEAYAVYLAHLESDAFLDGCVERGEYLLPSGQAVRCTVKWWYDDDDARVERIARAWIAATTGAKSASEEASRPPREFRPRVIEGGGSPGSPTRRPPGHEYHDPALCDVRTG